MPGLRLGGGAFQMLKAQLNAGDGACFPMHFDSDRAIDGRAITAILYLNEHWCACPLPCCAPLLALVAKLSIP